MVLKAFDDLPSLAAAFEGTVFRDIGDDSLYVFEKVHNRWHHYRWAPGKREIVHLGAVAGDLPLITQIYP